MAKEPSKRQGGIFGGKGSLKEDLQDISGDDKITFADTWLGDLLGFDGKAGVQGANLKESWYGARRRPYRERVKQTPPLEKAAKDFIASKMDRDNAQEDLRDSFLRTRNRDRIGAGGFYDEEARRTTLSRVVPFFTSGGAVEAAIASGELKPGDEYDIVRDGKVVATKIVPPKTIEEMGGFSEIGDLASRQGFTTLTNERDITVKDRPYFTSIEEFKKALNAKILSPGEIVFIEGIGGYEVPKEPTKPGLMEKPATPAPASKSEQEAKPKAKDLAGAKDYNHLPKIEAYKAIEADIIGKRIDSPERLDHIASQYNKVGPGLGSRQWDILHGILKETMGNN